MTIDLPPSLQGIPLSGPPEFEARFVDTGDVLIHAELGGPPDGEPVLFLHGWPDLWFTFEPQMRDLAARGYRVIAIDQRGYGLSGKPVAVRDYDMTLLVADVVTLAHRLGTGPLHVVGHDWGGAVAWSLALALPDLVSSLTIVSCPHPQVLVDGLRRNPGQMLRSWYMWFFQVPGIPQALLQLRRSALLATMLRHGARIDETTLDRHRAVWRHPGTIARPLLWYRALLRGVIRGRLPIPPGPVRPPVQIIWGRGDGIFARSSVMASAQRCEQAQVHWIAAKHWPHHERPGEVSALIAAFVARHSAGQGVSTLA